MWMLLFGAALERLDDGTLVTKTEGSGDPAKDVLIEVFRNGYLLVDQTCAEIRERAKIPNCPGA